MKLKNHKKYTIFLLLTSFCFLTACANEGAQPETVTKETVEQTDTAVAKETSVLDQYEGTDYGWETYTFAVDSTDVYPNYIGEANTGEPVNDAQYARDSWIEEHYNIDIQYIHEDGGVLTSNVQKQVQAGDTTYDCIETNLSFSLCPLSVSGMLANLASVEKLDLEADWWSRSFNDTFTINDKQYITTGPISFSYFYSPRVIAFNLRLAENYDIPDLYSVVDEGKWTLDYMYDLIKNFSADLDGDGVMTEDDLWGASVDEYSAAGFFISAGGTQMAIDSDGKPYFVLNDPQNVNIIDKVASIIGNADITQKAEALAGRSGKYNSRDKVYTFKNGNALFFGYGAQAVAFYLRDMVDDYGIIPVPKYDENQKDYITFGNATVPAYIGLPKNNDRGSMNGIILDSMGYLSKRDVQPLISEVTLKGKAARDEASHRMLDLIYQDIYVDLNCSYNFGESFILLRDITMGKKENFTSQWEKLESKANIELDNLYEQFLLIED
ncbi:MAG: carbohydrate ABC transporter substrate-binding protein [Clostridia bacterium]|nr:carbohydrate ABC transporter substrate-binding protein [Clostridia bacterium]